MKKYALLFTMFMYLCCNTYGQIDFVSGKQFGTEKDDVPSNVLADSLNNVFLFGSTTGLIGEKQYGGRDGFICKFDSTGKMLWAKQIGSQYDDELNNASFDKDYNIYLTGNYSTGETDKDAWILKLNPAGDVIWNKTYGTDSIDNGRNIVVDNNGMAYVIGCTNGDFGGTSQGESDCFILSLNQDGGQQGIVQFGTRNSDEGFAITIGPDSLLYVCGNTYGDLSQKSFGIMDAYWGTFTKELEQKRLVQFGTPGYEVMWLIQTDRENNIYVAGSTSGKIGDQHLGFMDAYLRKMDKTGNLLWHKQFGTEKGDYVNGLVVYENGDIVISGCQNWSDCQAFCRMYSEDGELLWKNNYVALGNEHGTCGKGICMSNKYLYHTGATGGSLFSDAKGEYDMYLLKLKLDIEK